MKNIIDSLVVFYGVYLPYHPGKWMVVERLIKYFGRKISGRGDLAPVKRAGVQWELDRRCVIQRALYYLAVYERNETRILKKLIKEGDVCLDIGANIGYYSMLIAHQTHNRAKVYAFEPVEAVHAHLVRHIRLNAFDSVIPSKVALGKQRGRAEFVIPHSTNRGVGHIKATNETVEAGGLQQVEVDTLDNYVQENRVGRINFIKMDVEGVEADVLEGGKASVLRDMPFMLIEVNPEALELHGHTAEKLLATINSMGYRIFMPRGRLLMELISEDQINGYCTAFCIPGALIEKRSRRWITVRVANRVISWRLRRQA